MYIYLLVLYHSSTSFFKLSYHSLFESYLYTGDVFYSVTLATRVIPLQNILYFHIFYNNNVQLLLSESNKRSGAFVPEVFRSLSRQDDNSQRLLFFFFYLTLILLLSLENS